jgi:dinuclear metal center YbgI/SA1388 family protein
MQVQLLVSYLDKLLQVDKVSDYCPNGLQVHGCDDVKKIVVGVTASMEFLEKAHKVGADTVLVHHGYFWKNEPPAIVGVKKNRIKFLLENNINLIAYHLPLDIHHDFGNNRQLADRLGFKVSPSLQPQSLIWYGELNSQMNIDDLRNHISTCLERDPLIISDAKKPIRTIAWCTGAAQGYFDEAIALNVDAYLSGEISENTVHLAKESGVAYISAGHYATERFGVMALAEHLKEKFNIRYEFIEVDNPA